MGREYKCRDLFHAFKACVKWETDVEMDKIRRDTRRHTEWWWLCMYDENGEIGKQAAFDPNELKGRSWLKFYLRNYLFGEGKQSEEEIKRNEIRLKELRKKQHPNLDVTNEEFLQTFRYDEPVDKNQFKVYTV